MKSKIIYVAEDGTEFSTEADCLGYEQIDTLKTHVGENCRSTYCESSQRYIIDIHNVTAYIRDHITDIIKIVRG